jgi:ribonuclease P protein component
LHEPGIAQDARLRRVERVRRRPEYEAIYEQGRRQSGRLMTVFILANDLGRARLGIAATRKLGAAVVRNRAKRMVREAFRRNKPRGGLDIVVIPRRELLKADYAHVEADFLAILTRRGPGSAGGGAARRTLSTGGAPSSGAQRPEPR